MKEFKAYLIGKLMLPARTIDDEVAQYAAALLLKHPEREAEILAETEEVLRNAKAWA